MPKSTPWKDEYTLLCERCGYIIEDLDQSLPCPECGKPITESLPQRRVGTPWQQKPGFISLLQTWWTTIRHPLNTLDIMQFDDSKPLTPLIATLCYMTIICGIVVLPMPYANLMSLIVTCVILIVAGTFTCLCFALLTAIEAAGLQFFGSRRGARITPNIAWAIVGHGAVGWVFTGFIWLLGWNFFRIMMYLKPDEYPGYELVSFLSTTAVPVILIGALIGLIIFETFAYLGLRRCKYANRSRPNPAPERTNNT